MSYDYENGPSEAEIREAKLRTLLESTAFKNRLHEKHNLALALFRQLNNVELPNDAKILDAADDDWQLDELKKNPALADRMNPGHAEAHQEFLRIHGIEQQQ